MHTRNASRRASRPIASFLCAVLMIIGTASAAERAVPTYGRIAEALAAAQPRKSDIVLLMLPDAATPELAQRVEAACSRSASTMSGLVLVVLRYDSSGGTAAVNAELNAIADRLDVRRLPAAVVMDHAGLPVASLKDVASPSSPLAEDLQVARERRVRRDRAIEASRSAEGAAKAKLLAAALQEVEPFASSAYGELTREVMALDADGALGLRQRYEPAMAQKAVDEGIQEQVYPLVDQGQFGAARDRLRQLESTRGLPLDQRQLLRAFAAQLLYSEGRQQDALLELETAMALAPHSAAAARIRAAMAQMALPAAE